MKKPVVLIVLDGWGIAPAGPGNAVTLANPSNYNNFISTYPAGKLQASGEAVGLPHNEKGNSETGHLNLGAGRIVYQDLPRINMSIADGFFFRIGAFLEAIVHAKQNNSNLHLMGLIGQGGVHSSMEHLYALLRLCRDQNFDRVYLHLFTDGRDSSPNSSLVYLDQLNNQINSLKVGQIASLIGRYYAMDRDNRWERTQKAYDLLVKGVGETYNDPRTAIVHEYEQGKTDEFIDPIIITDNTGHPLPRIKDNDSVIFFNYRIDRPRQLTKAFVVPEFEKLSDLKVEFDPYLEKYYKKNNIDNTTKTVFPRGPMLNNLLFVTMTEYEKDLPVKIAFLPTIVQLPIGRIISEKGLHQLRISESEKERFVSYYFNGQRDYAFVGEDRIVVPSPDVKTYDLKPEMSAYALTEILIQKISQKIYDFILVNFANPDMVGHSGVINAGVKACNVVDECLGKVVKAVNSAGGVCVITADHGNVEEMINLQTGQIDTEHSINPVPVIIVSGTPSENLSLSSGILADIAPTVLKLMEIPIPNEMTGRSLI